MTWNKRQIIEGKLLCPECQEMKELSNFYRDKKGLYSTRCRPCTTNVHNKYIKERLKTQEGKLRQKITRKKYRDKNIERFREERRQAWKENRGNERERRKNQRIKIRQEFFDAYGGKCYCCGETEYKFLTLEHIKGGGNKHRKVISTNNLMAKLKKQGYPKGEYGILCWNCNAAKGVYGKCPHEEQK